jgi:hypothetical protein
MTGSRKPACAAASRIVITPHAPIVAAYALFTRAFLANVKLSAAHPDLDASVIGAKAF